VARLTPAEFSRFLGYAYRSLKEVVTGLELSLRLYPAAGGKCSELIDEGNQISRMTYSLIEKLE
jgi:four helix bundle protein